MDAARRRRLSGDSGCSTRETPFSFSSVFFFFFLLHPPCLFVRAYDRPQCILNPSAFLSSRYRTQQLELHQQPHNHRNYQNMGSTYFNSSPIFSYFLVVSSFFQDFDAFFLISAILTEQNRSDSLTIVQTVASISSTKRCNLSLKNFSFPSAR